MRGKPSEFENRGPWPFGGFGLAKAWEKLRYAMRTGQSPDIPGASDLNAPPDDFGTGGLKENKS
jgi:hypothetical protein